MHLSPIGSIVQEHWQNSERVRANVRLDAFVVMPNHIHGIVVICESLAAEKTSFVETTHGVVSSLAETTQRVVSTGNKPKSKTLQPNSLGSIIGQFKSVCTKRIRAAGYRDFEWESGYYDHVIRDEKDLNRIREYIMVNLYRWESDDEFAHNIDMDPVHTGE
jgi:REP element-mobilizing transposase RayT